MIKEQQSHLELNSGLLKDLARKTIFCIKEEVLPLSKESEREIAKKHSNPLSGARVNFKFVENTILPIISDFCCCVDDSEENLKTGFSTKFGPFSAFNPEHKVELVVYNGIELFLCLSKKDGKNNFAPFKKINKNHFSSLYNQKGEEAEAIRTFGEMSKKDIVANVLSTIESIVPQKSAISDSQTASSSSEYRHFSIRNLFAGHKN